MYLFLHIIRHLHTPDIRGLHLQTLYTLGLITASLELFLAFKSDHWTSFGMR